MSLFFMIVAIAIADLVFTFVFKVKTEPFDSKYWKGLILGTIGNTVYNFVDKI